MFLGRQIGTSPGRQIGTSPGRSNKIFRGRPGDQYLPAGYLLDTVLFEGLMEGKNTFDKRWEGQAYPGKHQLFVDKIIIVSI